MKTRLFLSLLALFGAGVILVVSLSSGAFSSVSAGEYSASENTVYFNQDMGPDHLFYPVLMAADRVKLETASDQERIFIQVQYAHRRLESAQVMLDKGKEGMAVTTLTKGEKYLNQAVMESLQQKSSASVKDRLKKAVEYHTKALKRIKDQLSDPQRVVIDQILKEHDVLVKSLE